MTGLPALALSVRQPWAWAIIHAGKTIENRSAGMVKHLRPVCGRRAIQAAKGMTREEYSEAAEFMRGIGIECPAARDLLRGGIIGSVDVVGVVRGSDSPWFFGPCGLVLENPQACDFMPAQGALGYFTWTECSMLAVPGPARWMLPKAEQSAGKAQGADPQIPLL
jgi:hypothetical protein